MGKLPEPEPQHGHTDDLVILDPDEWDVPDHEMFPDDWDDEG